MLEKEQVSGLFQLQIRTLLPWEGTFPVDVNKSRRRIKRANTRTIDVLLASSRKRTFSFVAYIEE
jgi:hypothetical protein